MHIEKEGVAGDISTLTCSTNYDLLFYFIYWLKALNYIKVIERQDCSILAAEIRQKKTANKAWSASINCIVGFSELIQVPSNTQP
jgi:hypothetical protein